MAIYQPSHNAKRERGEREPENDKESCANVQKTSDETKIQKQTINNKISDQ